MERERGRERVRVACVVLVGGRTCWLRWRERHHAKRREGRENNAKRESRARTAFALVCCETASDTGSEREH